MPDLNMTTITVYGIPNCDTIAKTLKWYKQHNIAVDFHDYKKSGVTKDQLNTWSKQVGWETLLNKKSTTWRALSPEEQQTVKTQKDAVAIMQSHTSLIKRPVIEMSGKIMVGFKEEEFDKIFGSKK